MQRILCPFCDHEIKGKGKCDFCGLWVKKPVITETSEEFYQEDFSRVAGAAAAGAGISPDLSDRAQEEAVLGSQTATEQTGTMSGVQRGTAPRRAVLASEAVERGQTTVKSGNSKIVVRGIVIVIIVNIILQLLFLLFDI